MQVVTEIALSAHNSLTESHNCEGDSDVVDEFNVVVGSFFLVKSTLEEDN